MTDIQSIIDDQAEARYLEQAIAESDTACAWTENYCLKHDVSKLGKKASKIYRDQYDHLQLPDDICRLAIKCYWIAQRTWEIKWAMDNATGQVPETKENRKHSETFECANVADGERGEVFYYFLGENRSLYEDHFDVALKLKLGLTQNNSDRMVDALLAVC